MTVGFPALSVIIPTFNNLEVLKRCLASWEKFASDQPVELIVIEDGCKDGTPDYLRQVSETPWGKKFLRWVHENDVNQLKCNNRGFAEARAPLFLVWDDDMFLEVDWFVPELLETFEAYPEIGLLCLIRGLNLFPLTYPIERWEDLHDPKHMVSSIAPDGTYALLLTQPGPYIARVVRADGLVIYSRPVVVPDAEQLRIDLDFASASVAGSPKPAADSGVPAAASATEKLVPMTVATAEKWTTIASDSTSRSRCSPSMTTAVHTAAARAQAVAVEVSMGVPDATGATSVADPRLTR